MKTRAGVLGGILFFALFFNSVSGFSAPFPATQSVVLEWNPSVDPSVVGYKIYCGGASGTYTNMANVGNVTSATVAGLVANVTYYFAATAYDNLGQESVFSTEISYLVPAAPPSVQIRSAPGGQFILTVSGSTGFTYEIQATQDFMAWAAIGALTVGTVGSLDFTDTNAASFPRRFYRTLETPEIQATIK